MNDDVVKKIVVFLGPTMSQDEAKQYLPMAHYFPPATCGDILYVLRLKPDVIVLIDGYFNDKPSVWHKELLFAIEEGVVVIGASSMGALRAAELDRYGMIGTGSIYKDYVTEKLQDDDEVTVLHRAAIHDYAPVTDAMVNIRSTLIKAVGEEVVSKKSGEAITAHFKNIFYAKRRLDQLSMDSFNDQAIKYDVNKLIKWLNEKGIIDQKKLDCIAAFQLVSSNAIDPICSRRTFGDVMTSQSIFFKTLQNRINCSAFPYYDHGLPSHEKIMSAARLYDSQYRLTQRMSYMLAVAHGLAINDKQTSGRTQKNQAVFLNINACQIKSCLKGCVSEPEIVKTLTALSRINSLIALTRNEMSHELEMETLLLLMKLSGNYCQYKCETSINRNDILKSFLQDDPEKHETLLITAILWRGISSKLTEYGIKVDDQSIKETSRHFRISYGLSNETRLSVWLDQHDMTNEDYRSLINFLAAFEYFIISFNISNLFELKAEASQHWFFYAMILGGLFKKTELMLCSNNERQRLIIHARDTLHAKGAQHYHSLGFFNEEDYVEFLSVLSTSLVGAILN